MIFILLLNIFHYFDQFADLGPYQMYLMPLTKLY